MARPSPGEFVNQVKAESAKIVWPTGRETVMTTVMVVLMTVLLASFFFVTDTIFGRAVKALLSLLS